MESHYGDSPSLSTQRKKPSASNSQFTNKDYDLYLLKLSDKNKALKSLRQKDKHETEMETREKGFSVYINGANSRSLSLTKHQQLQIDSQQKKPKTADPRQREAVRPVLEDIRKSQSKRKGWDGTSCVSVKTEIGDTVHIDVPPIISGCYEEDFERDTSFMKEDGKEEKEEKEKEKEEQNTAIDYDSDSIEEIVEENEEEPSSSLHTASLSHCRPLLVFNTQATPTPNVTSTRTLSAVSRKAPPTSNNEDSILDDEELMNIITPIKPDSFPTTVDAFQNSNSFSDSMTSDNSGTEKLNDQSAIKLVNPTQLATDPSPTKLPFQLATDPSPTLSTDPSPTKLPFQLATDPSPTQLTIHPSPTQLFSQLATDPCPTQSPTHLKTVPSSTQLATDPSSTHSPTQLATDPSPTHSPTQLTTDPSSTHSPTQLTTEETIQFVTDTVKKMDSRMQKQLLEMIKDMSVTSQHPSLVSSTCLPSYPPSSHSLPSYPVPSHPPSHRPSHPLLSHPLPSHPPSSHPPPSHPLLSSLPHAPLVMKTSSEQFPDNVSLPKWLTEDIKITKPHSSPNSVSRGRTSGVRGQLLLKKDPNSSLSDSDLISLLDQPSRLKTAVISKGRHNVQCGSDICPVPFVDETVDSLENSTTSLTFISPSQPGAHNFSLPSPPPPPPSLIQPIQSLGEPSLSSSNHHYQTSDTNDNNDHTTLRNSIQQFDRRRHWHETSDQDDIIATFLTEHHSQLSSNEGLFDARDEVTSSEVFQLPHLPEGKVLVIYINSTWGDKYYVGLTGLEIFTDTGDRAVIEQILADPSDVNVLPETSGDPRVVTNLLDDVNQTRDDLHMWLTPFFAYTNHHIIITFTAPVVIAMIRIWNYNKSRIHTYRGVKDVQMFLDNVKIFDGEITKATGNVENIPEIILFTLDEDILVQVASHDNMYLSHMISSSDFTEEEERPKTADTIITTSKQNEEEEEWEKKEEGSEEETEEEREEGEGEEEIPLQANSQPVSLRTIDTIASEWTHVDKETCTSLLFTILSSWGDSSHVGLTELHVLDSSLSPISPSQLTLTGEGDINNLIDGVTMVTNPIHMWSTDLIDDKKVQFEVTLTTPLKLGGIEIWNYNGDPYTGVKQMTVHVNGKLISPSCGYLLRRAPGNDHYDYRQVLKFGERHSVHDSFTSDMPCGFVYQLKLLSSWGDPYYVGLTEIQTRDEKGTILRLKTTNIAAYPDSVNVLHGIDNDVRTPDKLIDGIIDCHESQHMWLSPILPGTYNTLYIIFDHPQTLSSISVWNYGKTPVRGVKEISVLVDDLLIYTGVVPIGPSPSSGILPTVAPPINEHLIHLSTTSTEEITQEVHYQKDNLIITNPSLTKGTVSSTLSSFTGTPRPLTAVVNNSFLRRR